LYTSPLKPASATPCKIPTLKQTATSRDLLTTLDLLQNPFPQLMGRARCPSHKSYFFLWDGHLARPNYFCKRSILEGCHHSKIEHLVFASSSSVYGTNTKVLLAVSDNVDRPISLYAATKKAKELMAHSYSHLYNLSITGLRFFTVYGLGGRRIWLISSL